MIRSLSALVIAAFLGLITRLAIAQPVTVDGTARMLPITQEVARQFEDLMKGSAAVNVQVSNTPSGFKKLCRGGVDIHSAARPILRAEMELCNQAGIEYFEVPIAYDVLTIIVNRQNQWITSMTVAALTRLWAPSGQIRINRWNQLQAQWPDHPILLFGSPMDSETFEFFAGAIVRKANASRNDVNQRRSSLEIVQAVGGNRYAIGYCPIAECGKKVNGIKVVAVDFGQGPIIPSTATVQNHSYRTLSRPLFLYINRKSIERVGVHQLVALYLLRASRIVSDVNFVPLSPRAYKIAVNLMKNKKVGTAYGGTGRLDVTLDEFLSSNASMR